MLGFMQTLGKATWRSGALPSTGNDRENSPTSSSRPSARGRIAISMTAGLQFRRRPRERYLSESMAIGTVAHPAPAPQTAALLPPSLTQPTGWQKSLGR